MESKIKNGSRSGPDSLPVQTRMSLFQIAALKAIAAMDGINSATLLRNLADQHIRHRLTEVDGQDRELLVRLLDRGGFEADVKRITRLKETKDELAALKGELAVRLAAGEE